jgi:hypothetical protein
MADVRFVPKSASTKPRKMIGALALVGALAGGGALLVWGCTDNSGNGTFVQPNRPFPDAAADGASVPVDGARDSASDGHATTDSGGAHADGANSDLGADR